MENEVIKNNNKNKVVYALVFIVLLAVVGYSFFFGNNNKNTNAIAIVNGVSIPRSIYDTQLESAIIQYKSQGIDVTNQEKLSQIKTEVLDNIINNELVSQKISATGIKPSLEEIENQFQVILGQAGGVEGLNAELTKNNITETQLRENITKQLAAKTYLLQNIDVASITASNEEVEQFYNNYSKTQIEGGQKKVATLKELRAQIEQQIISNKQQMLVRDFMNYLRSKSEIKVTAI